MNVVDIVAVFVLSLMILGGWYRGFVSATVGLVCTLLAWGIAMLCLPAVAGFIESNETLYAMMRYYTEGAEYVALTDVELTRASILSVTYDQIMQIINKAAMPLPMGHHIVRNIAMEAFNDIGLINLGDYFNETIVRVVVNILSLIAVWIAARLVLGFVVQCVKHGRGGFPSMAHFDEITGALVGLLHGSLLMFLLFLFVPIALTVLPRLVVFVDESFFGPFFYTMNPFLKMVPGI